MEKLKNLEFFSKMSLAPTSLTNFSWLRFPPLLCMTSSACIVGYFYKEYSIFHAIIHETSISDTEKSISDTEKSIFHWKWFWEMKKSKNLEFFSKMSLAPTHWQTFHPFDSLPCCVWQAAHVLWANFSHGIFGVGEFKSKNLEFSPKMSPAPTSWQTFHLFHT